MLEKTITSIETNIKNAVSIGEKDREDLLELLSILKSEVLELSKTNAEHAESITGFAKVSAHEVTRQKKNPNLIELSLTGLTSSIDELENTHPTLVETVNKISHILANMGI
ncbi:MAG: DUF4404 family protein [Proteobacteria bacterium]|nr:DUF4404 family protein [Pseudomonadota bacterium]